MPDDVELLADETRPGHGEVAVVALFGAFDAVCERSRCSRAPTAAAVAALLMRGVDWAALLTAVLEMKADIRRGTGEGGFFLPNSASLTAFSTKNTFERFSPSPILQTSGRL